MTSSIFKRFSKNLIKKTHDIMNGISWREYNKTFHCQTSDESTISVVIPTLWRAADLTRKSISLLNNNNIINDIIIISNSPAPDDILENKKIRLINPGKNIYVNPSWNLGVNQAVNNKICIMNDDVVINDDVFRKISKISMEKYGIIGMHKDNFLQKSHIGKINEIYLSFKMNYGFGTVMFFDKTSYYVIPENLKIYCGDSYLYDMNRLHGKKNLVIKSDLITRMSSTSDSYEFNEIKAADGKFYKDLINEIANAQISK